jgi:uncharacterized protein (TIGR03000 family)
LDADPGVIGFRVDGRAASETSWKGDSTMLLTVLRIYALLLMQDLNSPAGQTLTTANQKVQARPARIEVRVFPADAEILFEGKKMTQVGSVRRFVSPPLVAGSKYQYDLRVSWWVNGQFVRVDRTITVRAGDRLRIAVEAPTSARAKAGQQGSSTGKS